MSAIAPLGVTPRPAPLLTSAAAVPPASSAQAAEHGPLGIDRLNVGFSHSWYMTRDGYMSKNGGRVEIERTLAEQGPWRASLTGALTADAGNGSLMIAPAVGLKGEVGNSRELAALYGSLHAGANGGRLYGTPTAGVQVRGAVGVASHFLYAEYAYEQASNYRTQGLAGGVRLNF